MELSEIHSPEDIRGLSLEECEDLADSIRQKIIETVAHTGGHLSSNLGAVEITMALHRVFHCPEDKIIFDVGHQSYTHKLLTGRYQSFDTLRQHGGLCGFPRRKESPYDVYETGHASTALSAALGFARARDLKGEGHHVIAVVGDGAMSGGMCYEAINDCGSRKTRLIVILNDNEMSIAPSVGALSNHLSSLRASRSWNKTKKNLEFGLNRIPLVGKKLARAARRIKNSVKGLFVNEGFFAALGFQYLGPINGNDQGALEKILRKAKNLPGPVLIHCVTRKGMGYSQAERLPEEFHGTSPFYVESGLSSGASGIPNSRVVNELLVKLAKKNLDFAVITAAMSLGTGTELFKEHEPKRFFDVGIAEEHAVTLCAGMASGGITPVFFVYSTFLQRGYDQLMQDVCMQNLHAVFLLDRAGFANEDGKTHHGLYDFAYTRHIPNLTVLSPCSRKELTEMVEWALKASGPVVIRYPKAFPGEEIATDDFVPGKWQTLRSGKDGVILATGSMVSTALQLAQDLREKDLGVVDACCVKPLDFALLRSLPQVPVFTLEEHGIAGGFGSGVLEYCAAHHLPLRAYPFGVGDEYLQHGSHALLLEDAGLDLDSLKERILGVLENG